MSLPEDADDALYARIGTQTKPHALMLEQAARIAQLGYFVFNVPEGIVELCSVRHAAIFGFTPQQFVDTVTGLKGEMRMIHPDDRDLIRSAYRRLLNGETIEMEYRFYRPDGTIGYIRENVSPDRDADGTIVRGLGSSLDVTESRRDEERKAQTTRLQALGELTAGVAHDFNNILAIVMGNAELLADLDLSDEDKALLRDIVDAARRGGKLTQSLLNFAQRAHVQPVRLDLVAELTQAVTLFERTALLKNPVTRQTGVGPITIYADRDKLQAVLVNILINARDAIGENGRIGVSADLLDIPADSALARETGLTGGPFARLSIRDNGAGIRPEHLARVTEPFFTTKSRTQGSGLGLSMTAGFMRQLGGDVVIRSTLGEGTEVMLYFPAQEATASAARLVDDPAAMTFGGMRALVLEDEESLRRVTRNRLESWGFEVTQAATVDQALKAIETTDFHVALLDNFVPGDGNGLAVAAWIKARRPETVTILLTGLARPDEDDSKAVDLYLAKPVRFAEVRDWLARLI
ncbi:ATP-binding protein [Thetidibacter halocola]|uniref:histidine kinase n=1 Tax=Thetidibacter halocola TaxID=2827239 RepID=A0A8J8B9T2_9RHOB|nr:ATP-binding protein [Thetidibacter halocola]MBS0125865.1 PAS domain-containing protein [Thetidibacter halocola]